MFKNILLAFDGSEHAVKAARVAGDMARSMQAVLRVITIFDPISPYLGETNLQAAIAGHMAQAEATLQDALKEVGEIPGGLDSEILEGPVAEAILSVVDVRQIDLVIMGTRGRGRLAGLLLGSQSQKVVSHASCPVLLVR